MGAGGSGGRATTVSVRKSAVKNRGPKNRGGESAVSTNCPLNCDLERVLKSIGKYHPLYGEPDHVHLVMIRKLGEIRKQTVDFVHHGQFSYIVEVPSP
jgi:hypothetical protein